MLAALPVEDLVFGLDYRDKKPPLLHHLAEDNSVDVDLVEDSHPVVEDMREGVRNPDCTLDLGDRMEWHLAESIHLEEAALDTGVVLDKVDFDYFDSVAGHLVDHRAGHSLDYNLEEAGLDTGVVPGDRKMALAAEGVIAPDDLEIVHKAAHRVAHTVA